MMGCGGGEGGEWMGRIEGVGWGLEVIWNFSGKGVLGGRFLYSVL